MSKKTNDGIYKYIYKNKPFKNSGQALSDLIDGIYDNIVGTFTNDKKLLKESSKQISESFNILTNDIKKETSKYITKEIIKINKTSTNKNRRKNAKQSESREESIRT